MQIIEAIDVHKSLRSGDDLTEALRGVMFNIPLGEVRSEHDPTVDPTDIFCRNHQLGRLSRQVKSSRVGPSRSPSDQSEQPNRPTRPSSSSTIVHETE
jgi:hypothetical protein